MDRTRIVYEGSNEVMDTFGLELRRGVEMELDPRVTEDQRAWLVRHGCRIVGETVEPVVTPGVGEMMVGAVPESLHEPGEVEDVDDGELPIASNPFMRSRRVKRK